MLMAEQPTITLTLGELVAAEDALTRLLEVKLSPQLAYSVATLMRAVKAETKHYHSERETLIKELGEPVPDTPDMVRVRDAAVPEFLRRHAELIAVEATITIRPLQLETLPDITGNDILKLGALLRSSDG
jgi:hypothetical protein